jgi:hypothetical protein
MTDRSTAGYNLTGSLPLCSAAYHTSMDPMLEPIEDSGQIMPLPPILYVRSFVSARTIPSASPYMSLVYYVYDAELASTSICALSAKRNAKDDASC